VPAFAKLAGGLRRAYYRRSLWTTHKGARWRLAAAADSEYKTACRCGRIAPGAQSFRALFVSDARNRQPGSFGLPGFLLIF